MAGFRDAMDDAERMKVKLCLVGAGAVGKSSLIRRFVINEFDDHYLMTVGTKVSKRVIDLPNPRGGTVRMDLMVWDIMGQRGFRELLQEMYFTGAQGILAVGDLTRPETFEDLYVWVDNIDRLSGPLPMVLVANKADLPQAARYADAELARVANSFQCDFLKVSAKTGASVENAFQRVAALVLAKALKET